MFERILFRLWFRLLLDHNVRIGIDFRLTFGLRCGGNRGFGSCYRNVFENGCKPVDRVDNFANVELRQCEHDAPG